MTDAPRLPTPPWRLPAFLKITREAGYDDGLARTLFLRALVAADVAPTVETMAAALGVSESSLHVALRWLRAHDRAAHGLLRPRTHGGGAKAAAARWAKRAKTKAPTS